MSIDRDLRDALRAPEPQDPAEVACTLAAVKARARRQDARRRVLVAGTIAAAVALGGVVVGTQLDRDAEPVPAPAPTTAPAEALSGVWMTGPLSARDLRSVLRAHGLGDHARPILDTLTGRPIRLRAVFAEGGVEVSAATGDGWVTLDSELVHVDRDLLRLSPRFAHQDWGTDYRWSLERDRLTFELVATTEGVVDGVPGEAWQRVIFTSGPFTRSD